MPYVQDASMTTRAIKSIATVTTDPVKKSRTFDAPIKQGYLSAQVRASEVRRISPESVLHLPRWVSPQAGARIFLK